MAFLNSPPHLFPLQDYIKRYQCRGLAYVISWRWYVNSPTPKLVRARALPAIHAGIVGLFQTFGMKLWPMSYLLSFWCPFLADLVFLVSRYDSFHSRFPPNFPARPWPGLATAYDLVARFAVIISPYQEHWPSTESSPHRGTQALDISNWTLSLLNQATQLT